MLTGEADVLAQLLSMKLEEHLRAVESIEEMIKEATVDPGGTVSELRDSLNRLRSLRRALISDAERIIASIEEGRIQAGPESEALYALAGYYAEAAYHSEVRLLKRLAEYASSRDLEEASRLRELFYEILNRLE